MAAMNVDQTPELMELELPGFRFHPTEEELYEFYLKSVVLGKKLRFNVIDFLNIYNHHPQELPGLAKIGEREWYFFVPRDGKHGGGGRPNRTTENGFWKATGSDRKIVSLSEPKRLLGLRKTLVFYHGRAPRGTKTDWVMNEYRFPNNCPLPKDIVLCKIYRKATSLKVLEQRVAMEEERRNFINASPSSSSSPPYSSETTTISFCSQVGEEQMIKMATPTQDIGLKEETQQVFVPEKIMESQNDEICFNTSPEFDQQLGRETLPALPELQVPKLTMDWTQDPFWTQFNSPWLQNLMRSPNILN